MTKLIFAFRNFAKASEEMVYLPCAEVSSVLDPDPVSSRPQPCIVNRFKICELCKNFILTCSLSQESFCTRYRL
jgi:hypothetical protein